MFDGFRTVTEVNDGSDRVSGNDREVSDEIFVGSFTKLGSLWENLCEVQFGSLCDEMEGVKRFSRICSEVGVGPK